MPRTFFTILFIGLLLSSCALTDAFSDPPGTIDGDGETGDGEAGDGEAGDGEAGDGEAGDGEAGDGEAGDGEAGDGEAGDGDDIGECTPGDTQSCDCDLPFAADGELICSAEGFFGECTGCPVVCEDDLLGLVVEGEPCGVCGTGQFTCHSDGLVSCSDAGPANACGGCQSVPTPPCASSEFLICEDDNTPVCRTETTTITVSLASELPPGEFRTYFLTIDSTDPDVVCADGWELGNLLEPPEAYTQATVDEVIPDETVFALPISSEPRGYRFLIRRDIDPDPGNEVWATTHFACVTNLTSKTPPYFHPHPFRGPVELTLEQDNNRGVLPNAEGWVIRALYHFSQNPGAILTGCASDCGGESFPSIVNSFQGFVSSSLWPITAFSGFVSFANRWNSVVDEIGASLLEEIYEDLFQEYLAMNVTGNIGPYDNWRSGLLDSNGKFEGAISSFLTLLHRSYFTTLSAGEAPALTASRQGLSAAPLSICAPTIGTASVFCPGPIDPILVDANPGTDPRLLPSFPVSLDRPVLYRPPFGYNATEEYLEYLFLDYFPDLLFPTIVFDENGNAQRGPAPDLVTLLREAASCEMVAVELEARDIPSAQISNFDIACQEFYGDPTPVDSNDPPSPKLTELLNRYPFATPANVGFDSFEFPSGCRPILVADPFHGLRITGFENPRGCLLPDDAVSVGLDFGAAPPPFGLPAIWFNIKTD